MALPNPRQLARSLAEQGDTPFEDFIASMLVEEHPGATQTNPGGGGDGGIDVSYETDKGLVVWQIKNFHDPLTSSQMQQVKNSINRLAEFRDDQKLTLAEYYLATAWTPNNKKLRSFHANASVLGCPAAWHGEAKIRTLIAKHPAIYDRLIHGEGHLERFVTEKALLASTSPSDASQFGFTEALVSRQRALKDLEALQTGSYKIITAHPQIAPSGSIEEVVRNFAGVMHEVTRLDDGGYEVRSAVPNPASGEVEPIIFHMTIAQEELDSNESARDFLYWGKSSAEFDLEVQIEGGPFADELPSKGRVSLQGAGRTRNKALPIVMQHRDSTGIERTVVRLDVVEVSAGPVGGGRRLVALSRGGAVRLEFRMGSDLQPDSGKLTLETHGGQRPAEVLEELEALAVLRNDEAVTVKVESRPFATLTGMSPPSAAVDFEIVARALTEWEPLCDTRLLMPPLEGLSRETIREIEQSRLALRGEGPTEPWRSISVTIGDPVRAVEAFLSAPEQGVLCIAHQAQFDLGDSVIRLPRVLTKIFRGFVLPSRSDLKGLKKGDRLTIHGTEDATATWGMLHDSRGKPATEWAPSAPSA